MNPILRRALRTGFLLIFCVACASHILAGAAPPSDGSLALWYRQPAKQWVEALPIGNGRLGAMVFGDPSEERLQLSEDTLWAGGPYDPVNPLAAAALPEARRLIFDTKF